MTVSARLVNIKLKKGSMNASAHKQALSYQPGSFESLSKAFRARIMPTTGAAP